MKPPERIVLQLSPRDDDAPADGSGAPVRGSLVLDDGTPRPFVGYVQLVAALELLRAEPNPTPDGRTLIDLTETP